MDPLERLPSAVAEGRAQGRVAVDQGLEGAGQRRRVERAVHPGGAGQV